MLEYQVNLKISLGEKTHLVNVLKDIGCDSLTSGIREIIRAKYGYDMKGSALITRVWGEIPETSLEADYSPELNEKTVVCVRMEGVELGHWRNIVKEEKKFAGVASWVLYHVREISRYVPNHNKSIFS